MTICSSYGRKSIRGVTRLPDCLWQYAGLQRCFSVLSANALRSPTSPISTPKYEHFQLRQVLRPSEEQRHDPRAWTSALNSLLPPRLQKPNEAYVKEQGVDGDDSAQGIASLLAHARQNRVDLLLSLAEQGQWRTVVWLITYLVDNLLAINPDNTHSKLPDPFAANSRGLKELTNSPINIGVNKLVDVGKPFTRLDDLVGAAHPLAKRFGQRSYSGFVVLGQIWRSLGKMILMDASSNRDITPEILEIFAVLHSRGIMPDSIYNYAPLQDKTALRQPPTLHLLSSHILTSLSDAAWKAHETMVVQDAKDKGGFYKSIRPEIPGSMYRVRVGGVRHEIWLELVLWSCLQGGWTKYGADILEAMSNMTELSQWSAVSWRELVSPMVHAGQERHIDWDELRFLFSTGRYTSGTEIEGGSNPAIRTVSSEVITAYVDALVNALSLGVGDRGTSPGIVVDHLHRHKSFLGRNNLGLEATSWDAIVLRIFDSQSIDIEAEPELAERILELSSFYGDDIGTRDAPTRDEAWQPLSPYLADGTAAALGIMHRLLQAHISAGNISGALRTFKALLKRTDQNKRRSLEDFFRKLKETEAAHDPLDMNFESRLASVDYPGFFPQIPKTILGPFLDLVTDAKAFSFGRWLLNSEDPDGPIISSTLYSDATMVPSLIRFALATENRDLLSDMFEAIKPTAAAQSGRLPLQWMLSILESQIQLNDWETAEKTLHSLLQDDESSEREQAIAFSMFIRAVFRLVGKAERCSDEQRPSVRHDFEQAVRLTSRIMTNAISVASSPIDGLVVVMAAVNDRWAKFCYNLRKITRPRARRLELRHSAFNLVLEGVVEAYGSDSGRKLLSLFFAPGRDIMNKRPLSPRKTGNRVGLQRMPTERQGSVLARDSYKTYVDIVVNRDESGQPKDSISHWIRLKPSFTTVRIILAKALKERQELKGGKATGKEHLDGVESTIQWTTRVLGLLGMSDKDIQQEIEGKFEINGMSLASEKGEGASVTDR